MSIEQSLYEGKLIRLAAMDYDTDPQIEAEWTHDAEFMRLVYPLDLVRPLSAGQIKKKYEKMEKETGESRSFLRFNVRTLPEEGSPDGRLIGFADFYGLEWSHGSAFLRLGIARPDDRRKGYGSDTLQLLLRYAFDELNLYRVTGVAAEYATAGLALLEKFGFVREVRRRGAIERDLRRWDSICLGLLREEWSRA
jgi:RimJ/RimL family protein N-acetyltransferase